MLTIDQVRQAVRAELERRDKEQGIDPEFRDLVQIEGGDSGEPQEVDAAHPREEFAQCDHDAFSKLFETPTHKKMTKGNERFAATAELRKRLYDVGIATGRLKLNDDLALFLAGTESQARAALRRLIGGAAA
jgi:hypothetical protein